MAKSDAPRSIISGVVAIGAVAVLAGGIAGAVVGEREIVHHHEDDSGTHSEDDSGTHSEDGTEGEGE